MNTEARLKELEAKLEREDLTEQELDRIEAEIALCYSKTLFALCEENKRLVQELQDLKK